MGVDAFFGVDSTQDFKDSTQVTGEVDQGGLGMPDRDYYTRDDPKSKEQRAEYQKHVTKMFELMGDPDSHRRGRSPDGDGPGDATRQGIPDAGGAARS